MASFAYQARKDDGGLMSGMINADSMEEAGRQLFAQNLFVVKLAPAQGGGAATAKRRPTGSGGRGVKRQEVMWFVSQLSIMVETGITLSEALDVLSRQSAGDRFKAVLRSVRDQVHEGKPLSDAMSGFPKAFPVVMVALVRGSEMSGTMSGTLNRIAEYLVKEQQILRRMRGALIYPAFMFTMCVSVTLFLLLVILPKFVTLFESRGALLPLPTRILMTASSVLIDNWLMCIGGTTAVAWGVFVWARSAVGSRQLDWLKLNLPALGPAFRLLYQSRAFRTMGTMIEAGVPIIDTLHTLADISNNHYYRQLWEQVNGSIQRGERLAVPLLASDLVPEPVSQMIDSGDKSGRLVVVFNRVAAFVEEEYDRAVQTMMQFIEPVMVMLMGSIIGFVAIALLLPMFGAANVVSK